MNTKNQMRFKIKLFFEIFFKISQAKAWKIKMMKIQT